MFYDTKTLIVVYKDEMLVNQLKKLVETNDDTQEGAVVGTRDDSIKIVSWTEKIWLNNKKAGNIDSKVLFLGDIKGVDKLIPVLDLKFDSYGVKYGWAGDQAAVYIDLNALKDHDAYMDFLSVISELPIPDMVKNANKPKTTASNEPEDTAPEVETIEAPEVSEVVVDEDTATEETAKKKGFGLFVKAKDAIAHGADAVGIAFENFGNSASEKAQDMFRDKSAVTRQMLFYGIINLYNNDLDAFMRS